MTRLRALGAIFALAVAACQKKQVQRPTQAVPVLVATAHRAAVPFTISANGSVAPMQIANVAPQVDGLITQVAFQEGQDVTQGQVLFRIDSIPYHAAYNQARAALARDKATLANAQAEVARYDALVQKDYVTKEQADQQRANAGVAAATVSADSAAMVNARFNLDNTAVRAPIAGRTGALLVRAGNLVHASSGTPLVTINQTRPILVQFAVPATNLPDIQKYSAAGKLPVTVSPTTSEMPASATPTVDSQSDQPPGTAITSGDPPTASHGPPSGRSRTTQGAPPGTVAPGTVPQGARTTGSQGGPPGGTGGATSAGPVVVNVPRTTGTLSFVNNTVDTVTGTVLLKATFPNAHSELWPGEYVATTLQLYVQQGALVVPVPAVMTGQQGTYVFVVDQSNTAHQRPVVISRTTSDVVVIGKGLTEGERVVTDGQNRLTDGAKVTIRGLAPTASGGSVQ
jgi:membrane fusion protein, multidrug efflux system